MFPVIIVGAFLLVGLLIFLLVAARDRKWIPALWVPAIVLPVYFGSSLMGVLPGPMRGAGPDVGAVGMASGFYLLAMLPVLAMLGIVWLGALFARPRAGAWGMPGVLAGVVLCGLGATAWHAARNETVKVVVLDETGRPVADQKVTFSYSAFGSGRSLGSAISDGHGIARASAPRGQYWSARTVAPDGTQCTAGRGKSDTPLPDHPDYVVSQWYWQHPDWTIWYASGIGTYGPPAEDPLPLTLRSKRLILSPWVIATLRKEVEAQLSGAHHGRLWIVNYERSPEVYVVLPELISMARKGILAEDEAVQSLDALAGRLAKADGIARLYPKLDASEDKFLFEVLRQWIDPAGSLTSDEAVAGAIRARAAELARELVDVAEPYWGRHGPVGMHVLGNLAVPHLPRMLASMERMSGDRTLPAFADTVQICKPGVEVVRPFFQSANPGVAVAAILAVKAKLPAEEFARLLQPYSRPGEHDWLQNQISSALRAHAPGK